MPAASATSTGSAAPSGGPVVTPTPELEWRIPEGWRFLGAPSHGPTRGHFYALEEPSENGVHEHVDVYVVHQVATRGATVEERLQDAILHEGDGFAKVDSKEVTSRVAGGRTLTIVELRGTRREAAANDLTVELPNRVQVSALIPTDRFPIRVAMDGRRDLVERCRGPFFQFVDSVRVIPP
jgi:hypothetical protein